MHLAESNGTILAVTDEEILEAYSLIASSEGIFAEPGSCASIAGVKKQVESGLLKKGSTVVAVLTGNGLKDPDTAIEVNKEKPMMSREQFDAFLSGLKGGDKVMAESSFSVVVPASTANLGPGFDSIGLALNLYMTVDVIAVRGLGSYV